VTISFPGTGTSIGGTPAPASEIDLAWRKALEKELAARQPGIELRERYYDGDHRLQFATSKFRQAFGEMFAAFATNWCQLVVDVAVERLGIQGFRFGEDEADTEAWRIWQANSLDAKSIVIHTTAVKVGTGYLLASPPDEPGAEPRITTEHPSQVVVAHDPGDRRKRLAALKRFRDGKGDEVAVLYMPTHVTTWRRDSSVQAAEAFGLQLPVAYQGGGWDDGTVAANPLGVVPVVPLENNPSMLQGGTSDLDPAIALNDAANKFFTDMIHASEFTSFPQRVMTGVELPKDPVTGEVVDEVQLRAAVSRMWAFEAPDANVFELAAGSLTNYVEGIDLSVQHMAAQTRTPPHYLLARIANISGDALKAAETGLVARCKRKHIDFSDPWEETMRLSFRWRAIDRKGWLGADDDLARSEMTDAETIWVNPESRNPGTVGDELIKKQQVGVPEEILWEEAGYTPQQIRRMIEMRDEKHARALELVKAAEGGQAAAPEGGPAVSIQQAGGGMLAVGGLPGPAPARAQAQTNGGSPQEGTTPPRNSGQ
jgi:hypothetical protein